MGVLSVKAGPTVEPISVDEGKAHLRVDFTDDDLLIASQIRASRRHLEWMYDRAMLTQTLVLTLDSFDTADWTSQSFYGVSPATWSLGLGVTWSIIPLRPPVQTINSITYVDPSGVTQTLAANMYRFDAGSENASGRVFPDLNKIWPVVGLTPAAIKIETVAGFTGPEKVPDDWKAGIKLMLGTLYENREDEQMDVRATAVSLKRDLDALMAPYRPVLIR